MARHNIATKDNIGFIIVNFGLECEAWVYILENMEAKEDFIFYANHRLFNNEGVTKKSRY